MYSAIELKQRIIGMIKSKGLSVQPFLISADLSKSTLDKNNVSMPKADTLAKIADALGCSVDYLLGRPSAGITAEEQALIDLYRQCSEVDRAQLYDLASLYSAREAESKAKRAE